MIDCYLLTFNFATYCAEDVQVGVNCVGVGSANLLHQTLGNTLRKLAVAFVFLYCAPFYKRG